MNRKFFYFNPRLTDKLNMICRKPLTIVSAHQAAGKSTAIGAYLLRQKGDKIWQAITGSSFREWLSDFLSLVEVESREFSWGEGEQEKQSVLVANDPASRVSVFLKRTGLKAPLFCVLEMGSAPNREILDFVYQLAAQNIAGLFLIVLTETQDLYGYEYGMDKRINLITSQDFLMNVTDIHSGFAEMDIPLTMEEAALVFQYTNGWMPMVSIMFDRISQNGKSVIWQSVCNYSERRQPMLKTPQALGYSKPLQNLLVRMSLTDAFSLADAEQIDRTTGGLLSGEITVWECLAVDHLPPLLYYDDLTGLYHLHWLLRSHFLHSFSKLPTEEQEQLRAAHTQLQVQDVEILEELKHVQKLLLEMQEEKAAEYIQKLKMKRSYISSMDKCSLLVLEGFKDVMMGKAHSAVSTIEKALADYYETGRFSEGKIILMGSLLLKYILGGAYINDMDEFEKDFLYTDLFDEADVRKLMPWLQCIILLRRQRFAEMEALMEMTKTESEELEAIRCFFLARSRIRDNVTTELRAALHSLGKMKYRLPLVACYEEIFEFLPNDSEEEASFLNEVRTMVNRYRKRMRMNNEKSGATYGVQLTRRQMEAAKFAAHDLSNKEIAQRMGVSENTVKTTLREVFRKLDVQHRKELSGMLDHLQVTL